MKKLVFSILLASVSTPFFGQISGNINYENPGQILPNYMNTSNPSQNQMIVNIKGLYNVKAESYLAIFSVTQVGKSEEEANEIIDSRISNSLKEIKIFKGIQTYIDMISFVPKYDYDVTRKLFSKRTYNEVPAGFEIKKNIHIKFTDPQQLDDFIKILSKNEIYDLVKVDYNISNLETVKMELAAKANLKIQEKIKSYETILGGNFANDDKSIVADYKVMLPVEMYKSYQAYNTATTFFQRSSNINTSEKNTTQFYQSVPIKEFDFVVNPVILEPVIQVMYEIKVLITKKSKTNPETLKEYYILTANGDLKKVNIKP